MEKSFIANKESKNLH